MKEALQFDSVDRTPTPLDRYLIRKFFDSPTRNEGVFAAIDELMEMDDVRFKQALDNPLKGAFIFSDAVLIYSSLPEVKQKTELKVQFRNYLRRFGEVFENQEEAEELIEEWDLT